MMLMLKLYVFTDRFLVPVLHSQTGKRIRGGLRSYKLKLQSREIKYAIKALPPTDPLLTWLVENGVFTWAFTEGLKSDARAVETAT